jgi:hypothetical protein
VLQFLWLRLAAPCSFAAKYNIKSLTNVRDYAQLDAMRAKMPTHPPKGRAKASAAAEASAKAQGGLSPQSAVDEKTNCNVKARTHPDALQIEAIQLNPT